MTIFSVGESVGGHHQGWGTMYLSQFGLRARPFRTTPDVDGYYPATTHERALAELTRGLNDDEGVMLLQADPGLGKTLLAHRLIEGLPAKTRSAFLTHGAFQNRADLLQAILFDLDLPYQELSEQELRLSLLESCLEHFRTGGRTVMLIDEAHLLPAGMFEELRLLSNLEGKQGKAVQIILIGLPRMAETIELPGLEVLRQRLSVCAKLAPLDANESADYLLHQLRRCGGRPEKLLGEDVLDIISHACKGVPRFLNQAAHLAFSLTEEAGSTQVDAEAAVEAVSRLGLDESAGPSQLQVALELAAEPMPPVKPRDEGPPVYVYGGGPGIDERLLDPKVARSWQTQPSRAG